MELVDVVYLYSVERRGNTMKKQCNRPLRTIFLMHINNCSK